MVRVQPHIKLFTGSEDKTGISDWPKPTHRYNALRKALLGALSHALHTRSADPRQSKAAVQAWQSWAQGSRSSTTQAGLFSKDVPPVKVELKFSFQIQLKILATYI